MEGGGLRVPRRSRKPQPQQAEGTVTLHPQRTPPLPSGPRTAAVREGARRRPYSRAVEPGLQLGGLGGRRDRQADMGRAAEKANFRQRPSDHTPRPSLLHHLLVT